MYSTRQRLLFMVSLLPPLLGVRCRLVYLRKSALAAGLGFVRHARKAERQNAGRIRDPDLLAGLTALVACVFSLSTACLTTSSRTGDRILVPVAALVVVDALFLWLAVTILQRRNQAKRLIEQQIVTDEIARLNRAAMMGRMAAALAHELAQPLTAILSNAEAAADFASRSVPDLHEVQDALSEIQEDDKRAGAVLKNMRAVFRKGAINSHEVDLNDVVNDVVRLIRNEALLRGIDLRTDHKAAPIHILGDEVPLQQVLMNLVMNGMDAMRDLPKGQRTLTITTAVDGDSGLGSMSVEDLGPGISDTAAQGLFTPFFTTKTDGVGMGLAISKLIIESMRGQICLENRPKAGVIARVDLPLVA